MSDNLLTHFFRHSQGKYVDMDIILICVPVCLLMIIIMRAKFGTWFNYANVVNLLWTLGIITTALGTYGVYRPNWKVYLYIVLMLGSFNVVTYLCAKRYRPKRQEIEIAQASPIINRLETVILLGMLIMMIPELKRSLNTLFLGGYNLVRETSLTSSTLTQYLLYHYGNPIIIALSVISIVDVVFTRKNKVNFVISLLDTVINITIFASRWMLLEFILVLSICIIMKYRLKILKAAKENKKLVFAIALGLSGIIYITSQRKMSGGNTSVLENVFFYLWGSIACMGGHLTSVENYISLNGYGLGKMFFSGIVGAIKDVVQPLFHISLVPGIEILNKIVQGFIWVSPNVRMNNNVTMLTAFLVDGGGLAIVICTSVVTYIISIFYNRMNMQQSETRIAYFVFAYSLFLFGLIEWMPSRATNIWVFIVMIVVYRLRKIRVKIKEQ